jgi:cytidylate kinase
MFRVITISREYGSGGGAVARMLAERLGWKLVGDPLIAEIAKSAKVNAAVAQKYDECVDPWFHHLMKALWRGGFVGAASRVEGELFDADAMAALWKRVIEETGSMGNCVIVGRGGQCILQRREDVFHVAVYAPMAERVRRLRCVLPAGADPEQAAIESDRRRAAYIRRYFGQDWANRHLYHLSVSTIIGLERAASTILHAAGLLR